MSCNLARAIRHALHTDEPPTHKRPAFIAYTTSGSGAYGFDSSSTQELSNWLRDTAAAVHTNWSASTSAPLVVALALEQYSAEESACLLLVASQPRWVFVPIDTRLPVARQYQLLVESKANRLITMNDSSIGAHVAAVAETSASSLPSLLLFSRPLVCWRLNEAASTWLLTVSASEPPLYVLFTSGSTGHPKGVVGTRRGAYERVMWMKAEFGMDVKSDCIARTTRITFVDAVAEILTAILSSVPLVHLHSLGSRDVHSIVLHDPCAFANAVAQCQVTRFTIVPSALRLLLTAMEKSSSLTQQLSSVRLVSVSGEALALDLLERLVRLLPHVGVLNLYGSTEVSGDITSKLIRASMLRDQKLLTSWKTHGVPIGDWPLNPIGESTRIKLLLIGEDKAQEICVSGGAVAAGYLVDGELCQPPDKWIRDDHGTTWFRMGDICEAVDGELLLRGRRDRQIKIRGNRVQLEEIERALKQAASMTTHLSTDDVAVVATAVDGKDGEQEIVSFLVSDTFSDDFMKPCGDCELMKIDAAMQRELYHRLETLFGAVFVPHAVVMIASSDVPHLSSAKIDMKALQRLFERHKHHQLATHKRKAVKNDGSVEDVERVVLDSVQRSLNVDQDQITDKATWLELGGDSLKATLLSWELERKLHKRISAIEILSSNIEDLVKQCISRKRQTITSAIEVSERTDRPAANLLTKGPSSPRIESSTNPKALSSRGVKAWYSRYNQGSTVAPMPVCSPTTARLALSTVARVDLGKCIDASPLVVRTTNGPLLVFIGSHSHKFVCVEVTTSASGSKTSCVVWTQTLDDRIEATAAISAAHGLAVVGTYSGALYALDLWSRDVRWKFQARDMIKSSAVVIDSQDLVVVGAYDRSFYGLDLSSGKLLWSQDLPGSVYSSPVYDTSTQQLIVATTTGVIVASILNPRSNPTETWRVSLPAPVFASLVITNRPTQSSNGGEDRLVIVGCANGVLYALDGASGVKRWEFATDKPIFSSPTVFSSADGKTWITFGSHDGKLRKLSIHEGTLQWEVAPLPSDPIFASPYVASLRNANSTVSVVCTATTRGQLVFVDQASGELLATDHADPEPPGEIFSSPVIVDDLYFVGTRSNELLIFELTVKA